MLRVLLESRAGKQRRTMGATFSVVAHATLIAAVVAGTAQGRPAPPTSRKPVAVFLPPPKPRIVAEHQVASSSPSSVRPTSSVVIRTIEAPRFVPAELPPIDAAAVAGDCLVVGSSSPRTLGSIVGDLLAESTPDAGSWDTRELLMHVLTTVSPRYPEALRRAGIDGTVVLQFTVDTTGRVDPSTIKVVSSAHELFTQAAREALNGFRFRPAQVGGRHVPALAQMPFEFRITR